MPSSFLLPCCSFFILAVKFFFVLLQKEKKKRTESIKKLTFLRKIYNAYKFQTAVNGPFKMVKIRVQLNLLLGELHQKNNGRNGRRKN